MSTEYTKNLWNFIKAATKNAATLSDLVQKMIDDIDVISKEGNCSVELIGGLTRLLHESVMLFQSIINNINKNFAGTDEEIKIMNDKTNSLVNEYYELLHKVNDEELQR